MSRQDNLKPFPKGKSGNPNGRPKKIPELETLLRNALGEEDRNGLTAIDRILRAIVQQAESGDFKAAEYLLNRVYGKPKESASISIQNPEKEYSDEELKEELIRRKLPVLDIEE